jgi:hypothetical protein
MGETPLYRTHLIPLQRPDAVDVEHLHDLLLHLSRETHRVEEVVIEWDEPPRALKLPHHRDHSQRRRRRDGPVDDLLVDNLRQVPSDVHAVRVLHELLREVYDASADVLRHALQARERHVRGTDRALFHDDLRVVPYKKSSSVS